MIDSQHMELLEALAKEWRETPQELLTRLIEKEHFSRHGRYLAMIGAFNSRTCISLDCFMKGKETEK